MNLSLFTKILCLSLCLAFTTSIQASNCNVSLNISNIKHEHGELLIAFYQKIEDTKNIWPKEAIATQKTTITEAGTNSLCIALPAGEYGIKILHDLNGNKINDRDKQGMPTEAFAFSRKNNKAIIPTFFDSLIEVTQQATEISLLLIQPKAINKTKRL